MSTHPLAPADDGRPDLITDPRGEMAALHHAAGGDEAWIRFEERLLTEVEP